MPGRGRERTAARVCAAALLAALLLTGWFVRQWVVTGSRGPLRSESSLGPPGAEAAPAEGEAEKRAVPGDPEPVAAPAEELVPLGDPGLPADRSIRGRVVDRESKPVEGAVVFAAWKDWNSRPYRFEIVSRVRTDAEGSFVLGPLERRAYGLLAEKKGAGVGTAQNQSPGGFVEIVLLPGAVVRGTARDRDSGKPVAGAAVVYADATLERATATDANGAFEFAGLPPGIGNWQNGSVAVVSPAHKTAWRTQLNLRSGREVLLDFLLEPGRTLRGKVADSTNLLPIAGAEVGEGWESWGRRTKTDEKGLYLLPNADPVPNAVFSALASGYLAGERQADGTETLDFELAPSLQASGRVLDPKERPVAGARVYLVRVQVADNFQALPGRQGEVIAVSDAEGRYRFDQVAPGKIAVAAYHKDFAPGETAVTDVPVGGPGPDKLDVTLRGAFVVAGRVVDGRGEPVPSTQVRVYPDWSEPRSYQYALNYIWNDSPFTYSDAKGEFELRGAMPGKNWINAYSPTHGWAGSRVQGAEGQRVEGVVISFAGGRIAGVVLTAEGEPVAGAQVQAAGPILGSNQENVDSRGVQTDNLGRFQIAGLRDGIYNVSAWSAFGNPPPRNGVPTGTENVELRLQGSQVLRGQVLSLLSGRPVDRFQLQIQPWQQRPDEEAKGATWWGGEVRAPDGRFEQPVTAGLYLVVIRASGHAPQLLRGIVVEENRQPEPVEVRLDGGATVCGLLTDMEGKPARNTAVRLSRYRAPGETRVPEDEFQSANDSTDGNGRFFIEGVGPGVYILQASLPRRGGGGSAVTQVTVQGTERVEKNLQILPTGTVTLLVVDEKGTPVAGLWFWFQDSDGNWLGWANATDARGRTTSQPMRMGPAVTSSWVDESSPWENPPPVHVNIEPGKAVAVTVTVRRKPGREEEPASAEEESDSGE